MHQLESTVVQWNFDTVVTLATQPTGWYIEVACLCRTLNIIIKNKDLATLGFQKKLFHTHPLKLTKSEPSSERPTYPLQN